jgi:trans-2-enoyl-CoA reductase
VPGDDHEQARLLERLDAIKPMIVSGEAQDLIDRIKTLIAEKKYQGAMAAVNEAARLRLTPDQQKLVDELKQQVEKAMTGQAASEGAKAAGDLLKKK